MCFFIKNPAIFASKRAFFSVNYTYLVKFMYKKSFCLSSDRNFFSFLISISMFMSFY